MNAIVMAAGEGRRLRPLTERFAKPVLPIAGRPVIATLLRELADAGSERVTVVTGHLAEQVEALAGDGSAFGLDVRFARQPRPDGSADAVRRALAAGAGVPALVTAADVVYTPGDVRRFREAVAGGVAGGLALVRGRRPEPTKPGVRVRAGRVEVVYDLDPALPVTAAPLWLLGEPLVPYLERLPGPPYELKDAYQRGIDAGVAVAAVEIGPLRDLTTPFDLLAQNFSYLAAVAGTAGPASTMREAT
ncbi:MAG: NTP transferase domain-containing protein [Thermoleophilia bacterium]|nr:NTP transferase domain-containing protein [Thermoleophilia bacterium]